MDRSTLEQRESRYSMLDNQNIFDDEFAVEDFMVADGFRPGRTNSMIIRNTENQVEEQEQEEEGEPAMTSVAAHLANETATPETASRRNRDSTRKSTGLVQNPFASTEDEDDDEDGMGRVVQRSTSMRSQSTVSYTAGISNRSGSSASSRIYAQTHAPLLGDGGPSHPYTMYPQDTNLARTISTSTTTTIRPSFQTSSSPQRPAHPYNMYTQNVDADMDEDDDDDDSENHIRHPQTRIPVGFPGMQPPFQHRLEDDSMSIGAHSEQLPPYSEYPEDGAPTNVVLPHLQSRPAQEPQNPEPVHIHIPFEQRRPPQSMSDNRSADAPQGVPLMRRDGSTAVDQHDQTPTRWSQKSWKEKRQTKFLGVPLVWLLFSIVVVIIIIVVGASIAKAVRNLHHPHEHARPSAGDNSSAQAEQMGPTSNTLLDASPIPSSTAAPVPTGSYALNLGGPQEVQSQCLTNSSQSAAWDCNMSFPESMSIGVGYQPGTTSLGAWIYTNLSANTFSYGTMPPQAMWSPLQLVTDLDDPTAGPAFQFQVFYSKLVIAPPTAFWPYTDGDSQNSKRHVPLANGRDAQSPDERTISAGEQPWFCYWNSTLLEGFIYIQQNATLNNGSSGMSWTASGTTTPPISAPAQCSSTGTASSSIPPSFPPPSPMTSMGSAAGSAYPSPVVPPACSPQWSNGVDPWTALTLYPYVVKLEERRIPGSPQPYCQKKQILDDQQAGYLPYTVQLDESDPGWRAYASSGLRVKKRNLVNGACHCQWTSGSS